MKKWKKRVLFIISIIGVVVITAFIVFHDDSDMEEIRKKHDESIKEATSDDKFDAIGEDLENFETKQDSL